MVHVCTCSHCYCGQLDSFRVIVSLHFGPPVSQKWCLVVFLVINGGYNSYKWSCKWLTGVITLLIGVITPFITGRGPS